MTAELPRIGDADFYDAELSRHNRHFRSAAAVRPGDRVLDIGCGTGQTTRDAGRAAGTGSALGVDSSAPMVEQARRLTARDGPRNVDYVMADAQVHRFPPGGFDAAISRFGAMFFGDPVAAFTNIGHGLRPGARLVLMVWQARDRNQWSTAIRRALAPDAGAPEPAQPGSDPFALADPAVTGRILTDAGFDRVEFAEVHEPVYYGPDRNTAYDAVLCLREPQDLLAGLGDAASRRARGRLRDLLADHETAEGVLFGSRAWIVTARAR
jgi:SAM-dependent methyltransferase